MKKNPEFVLAVDSVEKELAIVYSVVCLQFLCLNDQRQSRYCDLLVLIVSITELNVVSGRRVIPPLNSVYSLKVLCMA